VTPHLLTLGLVALVFNLGSGVIAPALPLHARSLGADYGDLGLIGAAHGLAYTLLTVPLGLAADRFGQRALLLLAVVGVALGAVTYLLAGGVPALVAGKFVEASGWAAFWPALQAWVAHEFGRGAGGAMGVAYGAYAGAFVVGTAAAGFLIGAGGPPAAFAVALAAASLTGILIALAIRPRPASTTAAVGGPAAAPPDTSGETRNLRLACATGFVYVFGLGTVLAFLPVYAADRGLAPRAVGLLVASYWLARLLGSVATGHLSDRLGRRAVLVPGLLVGAVGGVLLALPAGAPSLVAGTVALGLTAGACGPATIGLIADHAAAARRGRAMGLFEGSCGLAFIVSGLAGGRLADALGAPAPYLLVAALTVAWAAGLQRWAPR
jgi:MFS family permease